MDEPKVDLGKLDRGDKTAEELDAELSPEAVTLVDTMAQSTIEQFNRNKDIEKQRKISFYGKRNRRAWDRMNRQSQIDKANRGVEKIEALHKRLANV